ncbi:MAG: GGDEF domain-containing protein [Clostridia bacterium]|nr:GGDEF domain-containing protein [Clostridia bacterium]
MENCSDRADRISFSPRPAGEDEFAVILSGKNYENREALMQTIREASMTHKKKKAGDTVASGIALYDPQEDHTVADVFKRADQDMYANKKELKEQHG